MKLISTSLAIVVTALLVAALAASSNAAHADSKDMGREIGIFGIRLYQKLGEAPGNIALSPSNVYLALLMANAGAAKETRREIAQVLGLPGEDLSGRQTAKKLVDYLRSQESARGDVKFRNAYSFWVKNGYQLLPTYTSGLQQVFGAEPFRFASNEEAVNGVNKWVSDYTEKMIEKLLSPDALTDDTRVILVTATYLLAKWQHEFPANSTAQRNFHLRTGGNVQAKFMNQVESFYYAEDSSLQVISLPYAGTPYSMWILLPKLQDGIQAVESALLGNLLGTFIERAAPQRVALSIPKFEVALMANLNDALSALGIHDAFDDDHADFSGMTKPTDLVIGAVIHQARVKVDEKGTEAAAATAIVMERAGALPNPERPVSFVADHPFWFVIRDDKQGIPLFMGRVENPLS